MNRNTDWLDEVKWTADGLVPALAQDNKTGQILMMAWMNREALEAKYVDHHSVREIAANRATSDKAVESLLTRAREAFRRTFLALAQSLNTEVFPS